MALNSDCPESPPPALPPSCRDLAEWPRSWMGDQRDLAPGQKIVQCFTPFLLHLAGSGLRKKTVSGIINTLLKNDGPLLYHRDSEEQQRSFESTCRKLRRFLNGPLTGA